MPVIQASTIIDSVIRDYQNQTTNRTALYDYLNRTHLRILRESQWRFLLSDPQFFTTLAGVSSYSVTPTGAPGAYVTPLQLQDFGNIAPGTVYNVSDWTKLEEDSDSVKTTSTIVLRDGTNRVAKPRSYYNMISYPGTLSLSPAPDAQNLYYPIPETPVVEITSGGNLNPRIYYGVVTYVDSQGGESTQCNAPFILSLPGGTLAVISSPDSTILSGSQASYSSWNLYIGTTMNGWVKQNPYPIPVGTDWSEPTSGLRNGASLPPNYFPLTSGPQPETLAITSVGQLTTSKSALTLQDLNSNWWSVTVNASTGILQTAQVAAPASGGLTSLQLTDNLGISTWMIRVSTSGNLTATAIVTPPAEGVPHYYVLSSGAIQHILTVQSPGQLISTTKVSGLNPIVWALQAANGSWWAISLDPVSGMLTTSATTQPLSGGASAIVLTDTGGVSSWSIGVANNGQLQSTKTATPPLAIGAAKPPTASSIQPLNAYVLQFRYYKARKVISQPGDILQVPYQYQDVVIAGLNYLVSLYLDRNETREAASKTFVWKKQFEEGLQQIRRDLRINYRKTDYINPDPTTQYVIGNNEGIPVMGW